MLIVSGDTSNQSQRSVPNTARHRCFRLKLRGKVDRGWMTAFDPLSFTSTEDITIIDILVDQAALRGILNRLWDLNLDILYVAEVTRSDAINGGT